MHEPYTLHRLIEPRLLGQDVISAVLLHADRILLGTEKGSLLVFDLSHTSTSTSPPTATLVSKLDALTKKSIDQLAVIKELNALVVLSGGDVSLFSFPDFSPLSSFTAQTKSTCSLFSLSTSIHHPSSTSTTSSSSPPEIHSILALACRRRLILLSWIDGTWNPVVEVSLPHQIRGMAYGDDGRKLVCGFSTGEYGILELKNGNTSKKSNSNSLNPVLGELFSLPLPISNEGGGGVKGLGSTLMSSNPNSRSTGGGGGGGTASTTTHSGLGSFGLGGAASLGGALSGLAALGGGGKKLEKNGVVGVPRMAHSYGMKRLRGTGDDGGEGKGKDEWLFDKSWGWEDEAESEKEGEVVIVRENIALPVSSSGKPRSTTPSSPAITYPAPIEDTIVQPPYIVSLLSPTPTQSPEDLPSLVIHAFEDLSKVQTLSIPPRSASPSIGSSSSTEDRGSNVRHSARLLSASTSAVHSPLLLLSTTQSQSPASSSNVTPTEQTLWIGTMKNWEEQVEELGRQGKWEEAIRLVRQSSAVKGRNSLPPPLLRKLAILHSLHLFETHRYSLSIDAFISLDLNPAKVVALYPQRISGKLFASEGKTKERLFGGRSEEESEKYVREIEDVKERESQELDDREGEPNEEGGPPSSASPAKKSYFSSTGISKDDDDDRMSIRSVSSRLTGKKSWLREREPSSGGGLSTVDETAEKVKREQERQAKLDQKNYSTSVDELIRYLTDRRQRYSQALAALLPSSRPSPSTPRARASPEDLFALPNLPLTELSPDELARTAQVVDTALFRSYLATKPVMVGPLCRIENWCEVEEVEELLLQAKKHRELLDLYNGKAMHTKAVDLLREMSDDEDDVEEKLGDTVRYLQKLGPDHVDVIFEASKWVFTQDPMQALQIFVADFEEVESLPRHAVMAHLDKINAQACIQYLEHIIHTLGEQGSDFHEKLIELYLAAVQSAEKTTARDDSARAKLVEFLETSSSYRADRMLGRLPSEEMHEVRAILLGRLGRHEGALQIYVYQLEDHATAELYCKRVYDSDESMRSTIFPLLLRLYLRPRPSHPLLFGPALSLLSTHAARIDPLEAFDLLPPLVSLGDLQSYLTKTLRRSTERKREAIMVKNVARSWVDRGEREVVDLEERRVKITESRVCPCCHKRIGNSVIAIHNPHGEVTHYQCREQFQAKQAVRA